MVSRSLFPPVFKFRSYFGNNADETATLARIAVPTLVLCGEQDGVLPLPESETLAREIPGARLVVIPNAGHASNQEQPDAFNATVRSFLGVQQDAAGARP